MAGWEDPTSEHENLKLMVESVFCLFRSFDKEDLGKISKEEFFDVTIVNNRAVVEDNRNYLQHRGRKQALHSL